jgi:hypothetical protein
MHCFAVYNKQQYVKHFQLNERETICMQLFRTDCSANKQVILLECYWDVQDLANLSGLTMFKVCFAFKKTLPF